MVEHILELYGAGGAIFTIAFLALAIAEWRRYNPNQNFLEGGCTALVEKAVFSCSAQAVADDVS